MVVSSASFAIKGQTARPVLPHERANNFGRNISNQNHMSSPLHRPQHKTEKRVTKLTEASSLPELLSAALRRRMTPASGLTDIVLAHALGVSRQAVWTWLNGVNQPKGHHLVALINFFDASFANEILGPTARCTVAKLCDVRAEALRKISEGMEELRRLG